MLKGTLTFPCLLLEKGMHGLLGELPEPSPADG